MKTRIVAMSIAVLAGITGCSADRSGDPAVPVHSSASGDLSLIARWWNWVETFPPDNNPVQDSTGQSCAGHQPDDVWFLAGTYGGSAHRRCDVPAGVPVFFPVLNQICTLATGQALEEAIKACSVSGVEARATLDDRAMQVHEQTSGGSFTFDARPQSSTGLSAGEHEAVSWGIWVGPVRLPRGTHTLRFVGSTGSFHLNVTYVLIVR